MFTAGFPSELKALFFKKKRGHGALLLQQNLAQVLDAWQQIPEEEWQECFDWLAPLLEWDAFFLENPHPLVDAEKNSKVWQPRDNEKIQATYNKLLRRFPDRLSEACGWGTQEDHEWILEDILMVGDLNGARILDLGCGPGSALNLLKMKNIRPAAYLGVDTNETMIEKAKKNHPENRFIIGDCFDPDAPWLKTLEEEPFDFILMSGIFACRPKGWSEEEFNRVIVETVGRFFRHARKGLAFNIIPEIRHVFPEQLTNMKFAKYHTVNRMKLATSLNAYDCRIQTAYGCFYRLVHQTPFFLYPNT